MPLAALVAWVMFALLIAWLAIVLAATFRQLNGEIEADARRRRQV